MTTKTAIAGVILPAYNCEQFIRETLESIVKQSFKDFVCYVIDDGSTDDTANVIRSFSDKRIVYHKNEENLGLVKTLNKGLKLADHKYIIRMDADDLCHPQRFEKQIEYLEDHPEIDVCGTNLKTFGNKEVHWEFPESNIEIRSAIFFRTLLAHPTIALRKAILEKHNVNYSPRFPHMEDADLWLQLINVAKFHCIQEELLLYRVEGQNITVKNKETRLAREAEFYSHVFSSFNITSTNEQMESYVKRKNAKSITKKDIANINECYSAIVERNRLTQYTDGRIVKEIITKERNKLFYKACDSGWRVGLYFIRKHRIINPKKWYYFMRNAFA